MLLIVLYARNEGVGMSSAGGKSPGEDEFGIYVPIDPAIEEAFTKVRAMATLQIQGVIAQWQTIAPTMLENHRRVTEQMTAAVTLSTQLRAANAEFKASLLVLQNTVKKELAAALKVTVLWPELPSIDKVYALGEVYRGHDEIVRDLPSDEELGPELSASLARLNEGLRRTSDLAALCADIGVRLLYRILWLSVILVLAGHAPLAILLLEAAGFAPDNLDAWAKSLSSSDDEIGELET